MNTLLNALEKTDYVIVDYTTKIELLKMRVNYPRLAFKILTVDELVGKFLGVADDHSLFALLEKYDSLTYEHAKTINQTIIFPKLQDTTTKIIALSSYQQTLKGLNFLDGDSLIRYSFKNRRVLLPKYLGNHYLLINLLNSAGSLVSYFDCVNNYNHKITIFHTGVDEVYAVLNNIAMLLANGVPASAIKILKPESIYEKMLRRLAPQFDIVLKPESFPLSAFPEVVASVDQFRNKRIDINGPLIRTLAMNNNPALIALYNLVLTINFDSVNDKHHYQILKDKIKHEFITLEQNDGIEFIDELPLFSAKETHYFYLNFANGRAPTVRTLNPYLSNNERRELGLLDDETTALLAEERLLTALQNNENLHLSFASIFEESNYELSTLAAKLKIAHEEYVIPPQLYSQQYLNYLTGIAADKHNFYKKVDENYGALLAANAQANAYGSFDYRFKGIEYDHRMLFLSPTRINLYQRLPFDYFVKYLLHVVDNRPNINWDYGTFVHSVLENSVDEQTFQVCFSHYLDAMEFNAKDRFFIENDRELIAEAFRFNKRYLETTLPIQKHSEIEINVPFAANCVLNGRMDRVLLFEEDEQKIAFVMDFKTFNATSNPKNYEYGLDLQLPLYGLLLAESDEYRDYEVAGLVLNMIKLSSTYSAGSDESFKEAIINDVRFSGLLVADETKLKMISAEANVERPFFATGGRGKVKQLVGLVSPEQYQSYITLARAKAMETYEGIINNDFRVEDKKIANKSSAQNSRYKEISFLPYSAVLEEDEYDEES
ncbi:MAG: ATP-dependent helicase/deoxyribonuclease subunit B [Tenericutes bacterium ADurb.Bin087]|nr:MAG: ATP-dependent helicase/deoxyribonuclease subunit B [Tenericutes bacterium ADurb.Bin087]